MVEKKAGDGAVVDLKNLKSRHRSAIMASGFLLSAANGAFVSFDPSFPLSLPLLPSIFVYSCLVDIVLTDRCSTCMLRRQLEGR